jgi:hypothetical protein
VVPWFAQVVLLASKDGQGVSTPRGQLRMRGFYEAISGCSGVVAVVAGKILVVRQVLLAVLLSVGQILFGVLLSVFVG